MSSTPYSRRQFLKSGSMLGGGLFISFFVPAGAKRFVPESGTQEALFSPNAYLNIAPDNTVRVILAHVEMGQGKFGIAKRWCSSTNQLKLWIAKGAVVPRQRIK